MRKGHKIIYIFSALLLTVVVLMAMWQAEEPRDAGVSFSVDAQDRMERISLWENGEDHYYAFLPGYAELSQVQICLDTDSSVSIGDMLLTDGMRCGDFQLNTPYDFCYSVGGKSCSRTISFVQSGNVATMYVDTQTGSMDYIHAQKGNKESGAIRVYTQSGSLDYEGALETINGRGGTTWGMDKKPYRLRLKEESSLLEMGAAQEWILLANALDISNLRNQITYDFARQVGIASALESQWVDLYLNGEYAGLYLLCERIERHAGRVDISKEGSLVSMERETVTGDAGTTSYLTTSNGLFLQIHYSGDRKSLQNQVQSAENAILSEDGVDPATGKTWQELIDADSWARKYLLEEIFGNLDACFQSQYFFWDGAGSKIYAGPAWDYDYTLGNEEVWQCMNAKSFFANRLQVKEGRTAPWFHGLYQKADFYDRLVQIYEREFVPLLKALLDSRLKDYAHQTAQASAMNAIRWQIDGEKVLAETENIGHYLRERVGFLDLIWLQGRQYHTVRLNGGWDANYAYFTAWAGEPLDELPVLEDSKTVTFQGWFYEGTDEPFDITAPITEDIALYAKWEDTADRWKVRGGKLLPLVGISVIGIALFVWDIKKNRKRETKDGNRTKVSS